MSSNDPIGQMLGGLLGGLTQSGGGSSSGPNLGGLLSAISGGGQASSMQKGGTGSQPGIGDIVGQVMGGNNSGIANSALLNPISNAVASKTGLDSNTSHAIVAFAAATLVQEVQNRQQGKGQGLDIHGLINQAASGGLNSQYLNSTGLPQQLAKHAGIDPNTAAQGLQQALTMMAPKMAAKKK